MPFRNLLCGVAGVSAMLCSLGCASANPGAPATATPAHHGPDGFRNNYIGPINKSLLDVVQWRIGRWRDGLPLPLKEPIPTQAADLGFIHANARAGAAMQPAVTWIGHATTLVQASGLNIITDPAFSQRVSPVQFLGPERAQPPGVALAELPRIDVVVVSHNHYDHLDRLSVLLLEQQAGGAPLFLVPLGNRKWMQDLGLSRVVELDWWQKHGVTPPDGGAAVDFFLTPVQHWSGRYWLDKQQTLWGGWAVFGPDFHWYFGGDTGYSKDFADTRERFAARQTPAQGGGFDLALLPIGAYQPRWFMTEQHIDPIEAVKAHRDLGARRSLGIHWGTFDLAEEPLDQPPRDLAESLRRASLSADDFFVLKIGETRRLPRRAVTTAR